LAELVNELMNYTLITNETFSIGHPQKIF